MKIQIIYEATLEDYDYTFIQTMKKNHSYIEEYADDTLFPGSLVAIEGKDKKIYAMASTTIVEKIDPSTREVMQYRELWVLNNIAYEKAVKKYFLNSLKSWKMNDMKTIHVIHFLIIEAMGVNVILGG